MENISTVAVTHMPRHRPVAVSRTTMARIAGLLYLMIIASGLFADIFVHERLVASRDAAATANNILAHEALYRAGGVGILVMLACDVAVSLILYELLKPVGQTLSLTAAGFRLIQVSILSIGALAHFASLTFVKSASALTGLTDRQSWDLALISAKLYSQDFNVGMVFFGIHCVILGYLIFLADFLPRALGLLIAIAGCCYLTGSFSSFLAPAFASQSFYLLMLPCFIAELALAVWLLLRGVDHVRHRRGSRSSGEAVAS